MSRSLEFDAQELDFPIPEFRKDEMSQTVAIYSPAVCCSYNESTPFQVLEPTTTGHAHFTGLSGSPTPSQRHRWFTALSFSLQLLQALILFCWWLWWRVSLGIVDLVLHQGHLVHQSHPSFFHKEGWQRMSLASKGWRAVNLLQMGYRSLSRIYVPMSAQGNMNNSISYKLLPPPASHQC